MENWRLANFGATANTGPAADDADPNHDGIVNKLEFFLNRDPLAPNPSSSLPSVVRNGSNLEYTYTRSLAALSQLTYAVEWSDSCAPGSWSTAGVTEQILSTTSTTQTVKATVAAGPNSKRFLRLRVQ
jgi:hypothetical protein